MAAPILGVSGEDCGWYSSVLSASSMTRTQNTEMYTQPWTIP